MKQSRNLSEKKVVLVIRIIYDLQDGGTFYHRCMIYKTLMSTSQCYAPK
jgi:hypothetical protein